MEILQGMEDQRQPFWVRLIAFLGRIVLAVGIPAIAFYVLYRGFLFLRDSQAPQSIIAIVAIIWGVGGVAILFWVFNDQPRHPSEAAMSGQEVWSIASL